MSQTITLYVDGACRGNPGLGGWGAYIVTEQEETEVKSLILSYLADVNEEKILYNTCNFDESKRIAQAAQIMKKYIDNFYIVKMSDPSIVEIKAKVRKYYFENNIEAFFYDYIFSSPGLLNEFRDLKIREDGCMLRPLIYLIR